MNQHAGLASLCKTIIMSHLSAHSFSISYLSKRHRFSNLELRLLLRGNVRLWMYRDYSTLYRHTFKKPVFIIGAGKDFCPRKLSGKHPSSCLESYSLLVLLLCEHEAWPYNSVWKSLYLYLHHLWACLVKLKYFGCLYCGFLKMYCYCRYCSHRM